MNHFYIVSINSNINEYSFGITEIPFEVFCIGKKIHLFLDCYNHQEVIDEIYSKTTKEGNETSQVSKIDLSNNIVYCDLKKLIRICVKKIQHLPPETSVTEIRMISENGLIDNSENKNIDISGIHTVTNETQVKDERLKSFEGFNLKIFQEMSNVNHILDRVQEIKSNVARVNKTLDSLRRFKNITGIPDVVQSERPRVTGTISRNIPVVQATPRGQNEILTLEECKIWMKNKTVNPRTGRTIDINGPTYKRIQTMAKMYKLF